MTCEHKTLELGDVTGEYHCGWCGRLVGRLVAPEPNSPAPTQPPEPNWTELAYQILPLIAAQAAVQAEATQMSQVIQAIKALTPAAIADIPGTKMMLQVMIARLDRLLSDVESKDKGMPVP